MEYIHHKFDGALHGTGVGARATRGNVDRGSKSIDTRQPMRDNAGILAGCPTTGSPLGERFGIDHRRREARLVSIRP